MTKSTTLVWAVVVLMLGLERAKSEEPGVLRKAAIFVENRAGPQFNEKVAVLEDLLASRVAGRGLSVISRREVVDALQSYPTEGMSVSSQNTSKAGAPESAEGGAVQVSETSGTTKLDRLLSDNTSALRLAQNLGADFVLIPTITTYGTDKVTYTGNGVTTDNVKHTLRLSYKIIEAGQGGAIKGSALAVSKTLRQSAGLQTESSDIINELLDEAAVQLAEAIQGDASRLPKEAAKEAMVKFRVSCTMADPRQQPILISALGLTSDNRVVVTNQPAPIHAMNVTVELDGVAIGTAPGELQARPGLHKIRLSREGFSPWERTINVYDGQDLRVALQMSDAGYARWVHATAFLASLDNTRKLTDAEVKQMEGMAKFLSESHYRVDTDENIKIYKSLY